MDNVDTLLEELCFMQNCSVAVDTESDLYPRLC